MRLKSTLISFAMCTTFVTTAQTTEPMAYTNFPIVITLQFHAFALPFRDMKSNFSNPGIGVGTEVSFGGNPNAVQQINATWYHNKAMGNGLLLYTQTVWRPEFTSTTYAEVKGGVGYLYSFRPSESFQSVDGVWKSVGHKGKGMLTIPVGVSLGYNSRSADSYISNFATYQFLLVKGYNKSIPLVPETLLQIGSRIHVKR
jgi:hypothetical protein